MFGQKDKNCPQLIFFSIHVKHVLSTACSLQTIHFKFKFKCISYTHFKPGIGIY